MEEAASTPLLATQTETYVRSCMQLSERKSKEQRPETKIKREEDSKEIRGNIKNYN